VNRRNPRPYRAGGVTYFVRVVSAVGRTARWCGVGCGSVLVVDWVYQRHFAGPRPGGMSVEEVSGMANQRPAPRAVRPAPHRQERTGLDREPDRPAAGVRAERRRGST